MKLDEDGIPYACFFSVLGMFNFMNAVTRS